MPLVGGTALAKGASSARSAGSKLALVRPRKAAFRGELDRPTREGATLEEPRGDAAIGGPVRANGRWPTEVDVAEPARCIGHRIDRSIEKRIFERHDAG